MTVRLTPEAEADLDEVFAWYSERGAELGVQFLAAFADVLRRIDQFPQSAPDVHQGIRRLLLHRFPYCVFYFLEPAGPVVLGCLHASRDPRVWRVRAGV
jgi:plasmid stabilization system protein ParE